MQGWQSCPGPALPPAVHPVLAAPSLLDAPGIGDEAVPIVISRLALLSGRRSFRSILEPHCAPYSSAQAASERLGTVFCSSPQRWQGSALRMETLGMRRPWPRPCEHLSARTGRATGERAGVLKPSPWSGS